MTDHPAPRNFTPRLATIGFGEAAMAFTEGLTAEAALHRARITLRAYDIKTDDPETRAAKAADFARLGIEGATTPGEALAGAEIIFSLVTADRAHEAAKAAAASGVIAGALFFDCNSCAPGTKRRSATIIEAAGGRYVDAAVMAPVHPGLHKTPILLSGPHAGAAEAALAALGMNAKLVEGDVGTASANKMIRSVMMKGLEALIVECALAGRLAGVDKAVWASLEVTYPGFGWEKRAAYMLERVMTHGIRRAAEMREVALTVEELGLPPRMSGATAEHQDWIGQLRLKASTLPGEDYQTRADAILAAIGLKTDE